MADIDLRFDFSTPEILDRVWARVQAAVAADERRAQLQLAGDEVVELADEDLEMLAAAGDPFARQPDVEELL